MRLGDIATKIRSKNAGPFWLTLDIFCGDAKTFRHLCAALSTQTVAQAFQMAPEKLRRFDIASLNVIKFSLPRPQVQGTRLDRDMHGASFAEILSEMDLPQARP